jgi:hypothetical protein
MTVFINSFTLLGPVTSLQCIGWDALAGYTFARVAQNHGSTKITPFNPTNLLTGYAEQVTLFVP